MHLLVQQAGAVAEPDEAVDLGQDPADVLVLSAADTELAALAAARGRMDDAPTLRLANLTALAHPMSVDVWAERTLAGSKVCILRVLGGHGYFAYGLETLYALAVRQGIAFAALPGDAKPDASLERFSTITPAAREKLWNYLCEGGEGNAAAFLQATSALAGGHSNADAWPSPLPLPKAGSWATLPSGDGPVVALTFYRALVQSGNTEPIAALCEALAARGLRPLPIFLSSLKDPVSCETVRTLFAAAQPSAIVNLTGFAASQPESGLGTVLDEADVPVLQAVLSTADRASWEGSSQGLGPRDLAMNVALPEVDGRVLSRAVAFKDASAFDRAVQCNIVRHVAEPDRIAFVADLAAAWCRLRQTPVAKRRTAIVLANYPNRDGRLGNGVGLDTPAGTMVVLHAMDEAGYALEKLPETGDALIERLMKGPTNAATDGRTISETLPLADYNGFLETLPQSVRSRVEERWGPIEADPFFLPDQGAFAIPALRFGHVAVGIQPARGYNIDPKETYHSPDLVPPHGYLAFYAWLRRSFDAHAIVHMGKHGNMEWLPGKALALTAACLPEAVFGPMPHLYPFIVNDPGEGTQAKRRAQAVIVDHLTPPLTRAETYGPLRDLERLTDEYFEAQSLDVRRAKLLRGQILDLVRDTAIDVDAGLDADADDDATLQALDTYLCELKEMQIRDGLHVFGVAPTGRLRTDLAVALARVPRRLGEGGDASLHRAIADDLKLGFDPLDCELGAPWQGLRPALLSGDDPWRTHGDAVERIEGLATRIAEGEIAPGPRSAAVAEALHRQLGPSIDGSGDAEVRGLLTGLDGRFVRPGPSGAPSRGRADVLPTGRNFYSVDCRAVPTPAAWTLGTKSAETMLRRHLQEHGEWPRALGISVWGTANMRTGGDDLAQAMALIGAEPTWDHSSGRVTGFTIIPLAKLARPRVDVTLRVSGFFRDAFPAQIELFDKAVRAIAALDEDAEDNPAAAAAARERDDMIAEGVPADIAARRSTYRVFGSQPGAYGAGLQALIDEKGWTDRVDLAESYLVWGSYAYGVGVEGEGERTGFERRLGSLDAVVHNQDNREHDLLDSDDYYQFEGGMTAAVEAVSGHRPPVWHNDHSRPERPVTRSLEEEIGRVVRARAVNPKWIAGVMRHGYKGAFEIAATVDYLFAFAATTGAVRDHHFDAVHAAYIGDDEVREFIRRHNPNALREIADRLEEAQRRGLWRPRSNSAKFELERLKEAS